VTDSTPPRFEAILSDPQELALFRALQAESDNDGLRLAYADWLEERGDPRGEYLRLECLLANRLEDSTRRPALEARLDELRRGINRIWMTLVQRRSRILNCGSAAGKAPVIRFAFQCPNQWGMLQPTDHNAVRFCEGCQQQVYYCETAEQVRQHALCGHCVAVGAGLADAGCEKQAPKMEACLGRPDPFAFWGEELLSSPQDTSPNPRSRPAKRWWQFWK
jgi:uncharacterized protein (TIGR02996 family)